MLRLALTLLFLCSVPAPARAQDAGVPLGAPTLNDDERVCQFRASVEGAERDHGRVSIVVLGDSHAAAGVLTATLHSALAARVGDAGPGLVFPVKPFPAYRAEGVDVVSGGPWIAHRVTARDRMPDAYGLAGIYVESADALAFGELHTREDTPPSSAELWLWAQAGGGHLLVTLDDAAPVRIDLALHSEAESGHSFYVPLALAAGAHVLHVAPEGDGPVRILGCVLEHADARGAVVDTLGINGARARDQLSWDEALFHEQLARRAPDLVVLEYGTNESGDDDFPLTRYENDLRAVVARIREAAPSAAIVVLAPTDRMRREHRAWSVATRETSLVGIQQRVAHELGCAAFDTLAWMGGEGSITRWLEAGLAIRDRVHLTYAGYVLFGQALATALLGPR